MKFHEILLVLYFAFVQLQCIFLLSVSLSVLSKVDCKISVSLRQIWNFEVLNLAMVKVKKKSISQLPTTYCWPTVICRHLEIDIWHVSSTQLRPCRFVAFKSTKCQSAKWFSTKRLGTSTMGLQAVDISMTGCFFGGGGRAGGGRKQKITIKQNNFRWGPSSEIEKISF